MILLYVYRLLMQHFLLDSVPLFIYTHYMFRPSYKAIFRCILFEPVLVTLVHEFYGA
jgi:hypothetical protein